MKLLLTLAFVAMVAGQCTRLLNDIHNEAPTLNQADCSLTSSGLSLSFNVNCNYDNVATVSEGKWTIAGSAQQTGTAAASLTGQLRQVTVTTAWVAVYNQAVTDNLRQISGGQTKVTLMIAFHGSSRGLSDGAGGDLGVSREIDEIFAVEVRFTNAVTVQHLVTFVYAKIKVEVTLVSTTAVVTDSWTGNTDGGDYDGLVTVTVVLQTALVAPFQIADPNATIDYDGAGGDAPTSISTITQTATGGLSCTGPYTTDSGYSGATARALTGAVDPAVCRQRWSLSIPVDLDEMCNLSNAKLVFGKADAIQCGSANDDDGLCPLHASANPAAADNDFTSELTISTSNSCPSFGMASTACGILDTHNTGGTDQDEFMQGDTLQLDFQIGTSSTEAGTGMDMESFKAYVTTTGDNDCIVSTVNNCVNSYYKASSSCNSNLAEVDSCNIQCHDTLNIVLSTDDYNIEPSPVGTGALDTVITFTARLFIFYADVATTHTAPFAPSTANNAARKTTLDLSPSKSSMYALLQAEEAGEITVDTNVGFGYAEEVQVEDVQPETESVQPAMAIEEESSSNLVYIVVGVLLVLSVGIAAVVMYMRRSKNAKKVVPVPITVEVRNTSATN